MNHVDLCGRVVRDPEMKVTNTGIEFCTFCVATDNYAGKGKERTAEFHDVVAWKQTAVFISKYFHKGDGIVLSGHIHYNTYEDKETGKKIKSANIEVDNVEFPPVRKSESSSEQPAASASFEELPDEGQLPF